MADRTHCQDVLLHVFLVSLEVELIELVKLLSATCVGLDACSHQQKSGEGGTRRSTLGRSEPSAISLEHI